MPAADQSNVATSAHATSAVAQYEEQQNDELEVLRCSFMDDFEEIETKSAWHKKPEKSFRLRLTAPSDTDIYVVLLVTLTATYPKSSPLLTLQERNALPAKTAERLERILVNKPKELAGDVMIFEIAIELREALEDAVQARAHLQALPSLEEERAMREAKAKAIASMEEEKATRLIQEQKAEEERTMQQMVEDEAKRREAMRRRQSSAVLETSGDMNYSPDDVVFDQDCIIQDVSFRAVRVMRKLGSGPVTDVFESCPATSVGEAPDRSRERPAWLAIKRVTILQRRATKSILDVEDSLEKLRCLQHPNLANIWNFKIERTGDHWQFDVLSDLGDGATLLELLGTVEALPTSRARSFSIEILAGLDYIHKNGLVHGRLHLGNVLLCKSTSGINAVKLADTSFQDYLHIIVQETGSGSKTRPRTVEGRQKAWQCPELLSSDGNAKTRKSDIWDFGIAMIQMLFGLETCQKFNGVQPFLSGKNLTGPFQDLIRDLMRHDPRRRPNAFEIIPYEFLRTDVAATFQDASASASSTSLRRYSSYQKTPAQENIGAGQLARTFASEWDETGRLGKGGYGEVVKARNKVDGRLYAIKKITQKTPAQLSEVLSEVHLLATLNHPYIVRYYTAWAEDEAAPVIEDESETTSSGVSNDVSAQVTSLTGPSNGQSLFEYGQSTGGLDFISSSGYPKIEFGDDEDDYDDNDDDDEDDDNEDTDSDDEDGSSKALENGSTDDHPIMNRLMSPDGPRRPRKANVPAMRPLQVIRATLYIQMEFCEKRTLRDVIRKGIYDDLDETWRLLRQILEGLSHVHTSGIIHRDLKPENIFIDATNNPKIGDFGLATTGFWETSSGDKFDKNVSGDMTRSIGTAMYVAPELKSTVAGNYTDKVDMYSLGIILFEMCHPLRTAMERGHILGLMRQKDHVLPQEFQTSEKLVQGEIIESLIRHKPSERPSSSELLRSAKIPFKIEDEQIHQALSTLSDPTSPNHHRMMAALFSQNPNRQFLDRLWNMSTDGFSSTDSLDYKLLQGLVKEKLISIYRRYGAVETSRQGLIPRSEYYTRNDVAQLLDPSGTLVQLPYDLILPHARAIARQTRVPERSFTFGTVFRDQNKGGAPRSNRETDFDIVSYNNKDLALAEAEVIRCVDDIVSEFPSFSRTPMCFHISHAGLLHAILDFCRIGPAQHHAAAEVLGKLNIGPWTWQKIRIELRSPSIGVTATSLDELAQFDFRDTPEKAFAKLQSIFTGTEYLSQIQKIFVHISGLVEYLKRFGVQRKVYFSPLSSFNDRFYRNGIMFQCLYDTKRRDVLAAGGRYDALIEDHETSSTTTGFKPSLHAVGTNIAWDKLVTSMAKYLKQSGTTFLKKAEAPEKLANWTTRRCDVLVASFDASVLRSVGVRIVSELRSQEMSAELAIDTRSPEELLAHYREDKHSWIVIVKGDAVAGGKPDLKIRSMDKKGETTDLRSSELLAYLRAELKDRDQREGSNDRAKLLRQRSHGAEADSLERRGDVRVLLANHKSKKANKLRVIEAAHARVRELLASHAGGPIASIEMSDAVLERIRETRLSDPESWRKVIQEVALSDRQYLHEVHDLIAQLKVQYGETSRKCFVYNFRSGSCIDYDMWL